MTLKVNQLTKLFIAFILLFSCIITPSIIPVNAQTGEGADVCTWYSANGFETKESCEKWLNMKKADYTAQDSIWRTKAGKCLLKAGFDTGSSAIVNALTQTAISPLAASIIYGTSWLSCMF